MKINYNAENVKLQLKIDNIKSIAEKMANATEYFDRIIENRFVQMPFLVKRLINDFGKQILQIIEK